MDQPAQKSYFFGPCSEDRNAVIAAAWKETHELGSSLTNKFGYKGNNRYLAVIVGFWGWSARAVYTGVTTVFMLTMTLLHAAFVGACQSAAGATVALLRLSDAFWTRLWRIRHPCPENYCRDCRPHHLCPSCGVVHTDLRPGPHGVFRRVCQCGVSLPTMHRFGRASLECICSVCGSSLANLQSSDIHVALAGGAFSGKTNLLYMSMMKMQQTHLRAGLTELKFAEVNQKRAVERQVESLTRGVPADKTVEVAPRALQVLAGRKLLPVPTRIHFYDVAGESFDSDRATAEHAFYDRLDTIIFVIDPLSIPRVEERHKDEIAKEMLQSCSTLPEHAYGRMLGRLKSYSAQASERFRGIRLAVVLNKVDLFGVQHEIAALREAAAATLDKGADPVSEAVRQWLIEQGQANLVRAINDDFARTRYFAVSALGRSPSSSDTSGFEGIDVLAPLIWGMGHKLKWRN